MSKTTFKKDVAEILLELSAQFDENEIQWRPGGGGKELAYIDARTVMERLDDVVGAENWQDTYAETTAGRVLCGLSIRLGNEWITKSDGAGDTGVEGEKGAISDAFKRAAVKWGIGRYLYDLPKDAQGQSYLTKFSSKQMKTKVWKALRDAAAEGDALKARETVEELTNGQKLEIWNELSSGQRAELKRLLAE